MCSRLRSPGAWVGRGHLLSVRWARAQLPQKHQERRLPPANLEAPKATPVAPVPQAPRPGELAQTAGPGQGSRPEPCSPARLLPALQDLKKYGATTVVRVCEVTYDKALLEKDGITVVVRGSRCGGSAGGGGPSCLGGAVRQAPSALPRAACRPGRFVPGPGVVWTRLGGAQALGCVTSSQSPPLCAARPLSSVFVPAGLALEAERLR